MGRTKQVPRCSHTGPPCHLCIRSSLLNEFLSTSAASGLEAEEERRLRDIIDVKVAASVLANGNNKKTFNRRVMAILPEVHKEAQSAYERALSVSGITSDAARVSALDVVSAKLDVMFRRYDRNEELESKPANARRAERKRRRDEDRCVKYNIHIEGGPSAADNADFRAVVLKMSRESRDAIMQQCTNPAREGEALQLLVWETEGDCPSYQYKLLNRCDSGVGNGPGADWEMTYISGGMQRSKLESEEP